MSVLSALGLMFLHSGSTAKTLRGYCLKAGVGVIALSLCSWWSDLPVSAKGSFQKDVPDPQSEAQRENNTRRLIMREEQLFKEMKTSATELERLAKVFARRWEAAPASVKPVFTDDDREQLKQIDKLAKKIRSSQGAYGSEDESEIPKQFREQIVLLVKLAEEIKVKADKATRQTLSVGILSRVTRIQRLVKTIRAVSNS